MECDAKIRPFPDATEITCIMKSRGHTAHRGVLENAAYPGSRTEIVWQEDDRRTFRGQWIPCDKAYCVLPLNHRSGHAF